MTSTTRSDGFPLVLRVATFSEPLLAALIQEYCMTSEHHKTITPKVQVLRVMQDLIVHIHMGGCQNYGPFWDTLNIRCRIIMGTPKGTIILTTTHIHICIYICSRCKVVVRRHPRLSGREQLDLLKYEVLCNALRVQGPKS